MVSVQVMRALTQEHKVLLRRLAQAEEVVAARRAEVKRIVDAIRLLSDDANTRSSVNPAQHRTGITRDVLTILREAGELLAWDEILQLYVDHTNSPPPSHSSLQRALTNLWNRGVVRMQVISGERLWMVASGLPNAPAGGADDILGTSDRDRL